MDPMPQPEPEVEFEQQFELARLRRGLIRPVPSAPPPSLDDPPWEQRHVLYGGEAFFSPARFANVDDQSEDGEARTASWVEATSGRQSSLCSEELKLLGCNLEWSDSDDSDLRFAGAKGITYL